MSTALPGLKSPQRQPAAHGVLTATLDGSLVHSMLITEKVIRIGRLPDNEFVLPHPTVSRHHAEVRIQNGQVVLTDVGSASSDTRTPSVQAISLNECRVPSTRTEGERVTRSASSSRDRGRRTCAGPYATFPAQLRSVLSELSATPRA